jgi:cytochrome P450
VLLTLAGHQPTADWIGSTLLRILTDDRFTASPLGGRNSVTQAMNEVLWEESPTQVLAGRWAARDTRLADRDLRAGDLLLLGLQGANNDPAIREGRAVADGASGGNGAHFAFGHGARRCPFPAQEIAETVTRTGVEILLDRLPDVEPATPPGGPARRATPWLRGPAALPARFTAVPVRGTGLVVP